MTSSRALSSGPFEKLAEELHKPVRRKFQRRQVLVSEIDDVWGMDLVEMQEWSRDNKGYRYMLNIIDCFSKFAWSVPIKDKTGLTVLNALKEIIKQSGRQPKHIWVDQGREFYNKYFDEWLSATGIIRYSTFGEHKSAIAERFNLTLKRNMWKRFTAENTRNWIDMLDDLLWTYNNKIHSAIGMSPINASKEINIEKVINNGRYIQYKKSQIKFKVGDYIRISRLKGLFEKGFLPNWSEEIFIVVEVKKTIPVTYKIKDSTGEILEGSFYNEELQKTDKPTEDSMFRVEKVIRKKKINGVEHAFVKWVGYDKKYNQWIPVKDLKSI